MPDLLQDKLTKLTKQEALSALYAGWCAQFGEPPKNEDSLRVLMSQWALETGWGKAMHNFNFGNVKSRAGDGYDYCMFRCYEVVGGKTVWYDPPSPVTRFRAFRTAIDGAKDYIKILNKRFTLSWPSVLSGSPAAFSHALRQQGYHTADETQYTATLTSVFKSLKGIVIDKSQAPATSGAGAADASTDTPPVAKNVTGGLGAAAVRTALTRSLSAHGWTFTGGAAWSLDDPGQAADQFHAVKLLPGDTITLVNGAGPRCGRVVMVLVADGEYADSGNVWVASASGSKQQVVIEKHALEAPPRDFDASTLQGGKPLQAWRDAETRPSTGHAWVVGLIRTSRVQRAAVDGMTAAQRTKLKIEQGDAEVTPGTVLSRAAKQHAGDGTIQDVPFGETAPQVAASTPAAATGASNDAAAPLTTPDNDEIPPPIQIDPHTVQLRIGQHAGRVGFTVQRPGEPLPTCPPAGDAPAPNADGKRDAFIRAAMGFLGTPYLANSVEPSQGLDGVGLLSICLRRVGVLAKDAPPLTVDGLNGMFEHHGGTADHVPEDILPGDIAWFGKGTHDVDAQQHPMIYLGGARVLGPIADGGPKGDAVQVIHIADVPEHFAGWSHIHDIGTDTEHVEHPGAAPQAGAIGSAAVLPAAPAPRYDALKQIAQAQGADWFDEKGKVNLVGVKNMHDRSVILPKENDWNDTVFAAYLDEDGNKCCIEMRASINPGTDQDRAGTWQLAEGSHKFALKDGDGTDGQALQPSGEIKGWFDEHGAGELRLGDLKEAAEAKGGGAGSGDADAKSSDSSADDSGGGDAKDDAAAPEETTTAAPEETTTAAPEETTTAAPEETTTAAPAETTTAAPAETTTAAPEETTTAAPEETTTAAPAETTTAAPATTTTAPPATTTTAAPATTTTAAPATTTTAAPAATTTAAPATTTTAAPTTTTAAPHPTTTTAPPTKHHQPHPAPGKGSAALPDGDKPGYRDLPPFGRLEYVNAPTKGDKRTVKITNGFDKSIVPVTVDVGGPKPISVHMHKLVVQSFTEALKAAVAASGYRPSAVAFNPRYQSGNKTLSLHSFGIAVDFDASRNSPERGKKGADLNDQGTVPDISEADSLKIAPMRTKQGQLFVKAFTDRGWVWGGKFKKGTPYDDMHFELRNP